MSIALWCVLVAALLPILTTGLSKIGTPFDNARPRAYADTFTGWRQRAYAAHQNGFEAFPFFAVAVLVAVIQGGDPATVDWLALLWIVARIGYVACYIADWPTTRSVVWTIALMLAIAIFVTPAFA